MTTQSDVANLAGVSTATVSRVVNGHGVVTDAIRQRVEQAIERLEYVPNANARSLALQRSGTLGAIIPTLSNAIFAEGMNAFERVARSQGYAVILAVSQYDPVQHSDQVKRMIEQGVDGLLLVGNDHQPAVFERLAKAGMRHVCTHAFKPDAHAPNIGFDNAKAMYAVVDHLVELGHRHVGMLAARSSRNDRARGRIKGVISRLNHHGIALPPRCIVEVDSSLQQSRKALWEVINNDVSAVVCGNDVIAQGALLEALSMGLSLPDDLSITGFDNLELSAHLTPAITTVQINAASMAECAARELIAAIENKSDVKSCELSTSLVVRGTTGPCST